MVGLGIVVISLNASANRYKIKTDPTPCVTHLPLADEENTLSSLYWVNQ